MMLGWLRAEAAQGFLHEPLAARGAGAAFARDQLEGYRALQGDIERAVDYVYAAFPELGFDPVVS